MVKHWTTLLSASFVLSACAAAPTTYYVDSRSGRDDATGTAAQNDGAKGPLRTLAQVAKLRLFTGDQVLLKCGQSFNGPLRITPIRSGEEGALKIGAYGDCNEGNFPVVTGATALPQGTRQPNGTTLWHLPRRVSHLAVNGQLLPMARYPNQGYQLWTRDGEQADAVAALRALVPGKDLAGAQIWVRSQDWFLEGRNVVGKTDKLKLDDKFAYPIRKGVGIYVTGKPWMIGAAPAWAYDDADKTLTARLPDAVRDVSATPDGNLIEIEGDGNVSVSRLHLQDAGATALFIHQTGAFAQVKNVIIDRAGGNGVHIAGAAQAYVEDSAISDTGLDGILFTEGRHVYAYDNTVRRAGLFGPPKGALAAINAHRTNRAEIENNLVEDAAYVGIRFSGDAHVKRNIVIRACRVLSDCGAIYTWRRDVNHVEPPCDVSHNTIIGVNGDTSVRFSMVDFFSGIYLDDFTRNVSVVDNMVVDAAQGIYVHNAVHNAIVANKVIGTRNPSWQILVGVDQHRFPASEKLDNDIRDNELTPRLPPYKLPASVALRANRIGLLDAGSKKIAFGWVNWKSVDWSQVSPGCSPSGDSLMRMPSSSEAQPTAILLDCFKLRP